MINVLITGCSKGFGLLFAEILAQEKFKVYATARNLEAAPELLALKNRFKTLETLELDILNIDHIERVTEIIKNEGKLNVLINNAGYGLMSNFGDLDAAELYKQFATNFFAPVELTRQLLPYLKPNGLIINISSIASYLGLPSFGAYSASKAALNTLSMSLACENPDSNLSVAVIQPGPYSTHFRNSVHQLGETSSYGAIRSKLFKTQENPQEVARLVLELINKKKANKLGPYSEIPIGSNSNLLRIISRWLPQEWLIDYIAHKMKSK
jgi:short-subunit dehydrogenase